jgi:hypothetical protein
MKLLRCKLLIFWIVLACGMAHSSPVTASPASIRLVADLDGDHIPDVAVAKIEHSVISIKIRLSSGHTRLLLSAPIGREVGLRLTAYNVDDDSNVDLVLTSETSNEPVAIWVTASKGKFEKLKGWVPPVLERQSGPHFYRRPLQSPDRNIIGSNNPVPLVIAENDLPCTLDEYRQDVNEGLVSARLRPTFYTYERGPPLS